MTKYIYKIYTTNGFDTNGVDYIDGTADYNKIGEIIKKYLQSINFNSYYCRYNMLNNSQTIVDYGSHSKFLLIERVENNG